MVIELALGQVVAGAIGEEGNNKLEVALESIAAADSVVTDQERQVIRDLLR